MASNRKNSYYLLSLGCAKNTVDSESMAALLEDADARHCRRRSEVLIVNTWFIARQ
jgi:ribosomal protein S12 methylthiotransferase